MQWFTPYGVGFCIYSGKVLLNRNRVIALTPRFFCGVNGNPRRFLTKEKTMKHANLLLALIFTASAFFCACSDSDDDPVSAGTPSDVFTKHEKYTYVFISDFSTTCESITSITDMEYNFGPGNSVTIKTTDAEGVDYTKGVYRLTTDDYGIQYYMIQVSGIDAVFKYYPNYALYATVNGIFEFLSNNKKDVDNFVTQYCAN